MILRIYKSNHTTVTLIFTLLLLLSTTALAKKSPIAELHQTGLYGRVHAWHKATPKAHRIAVEVPYNAPIIISDYHSSVGANGLGRSGKHHGVDIFAKTGTPIIAAADGQVIRSKIDKCWGPTVLMSHGLDKNGRRLYALYGHMRNINVSIGQHVKRGQKIAEMGEDIFTSCGAGVHHLHFQLSYNPRRIPLGWGWANFVMDGAIAPNPHKYWANGEGRVTCFEKGKTYSKSGLTYPLPCNNMNEKISDETVFAQHGINQNTRKQVIISSIEKALADQAASNEKMDIQIVQIQVKSNPEYPDYDRLEGNFLSSLEVSLAEEILAEETSEQVAFSEHKEIVSDH